MTLAEINARAEANLLDPAMRLIYDEMIRRGNSPTIAIMCLSQCAPMMGQSDRQFGQSHQRLMSKMADNQEEICRIAQKAGINTSGKFYVSGLGRYNDPRAWCSSVDDVRQALKDKPHLSAHGPGIKHEGRETPPPAPVAMAPDLVKREVAKEIASDPRLREKVKKGKVKRKDVEQRVIHKYGNRRAIASV